MGRDTMSESEPAMGPRGGSRGPAIFAGPADRANPAVHEALRHTTNAPNFAFASPGQQAVVPAFSHLGPPATPGGASNKYGESPAGGGGSMRSPLGAPTITPSPVPGGGTVVQHGFVKTAVDALATEGRIIEDAAIHEQYSRVITPEPPPTEETEEVCYLLQQALEARRRWLFKPVATLDQLTHDEEAHRMRDCFDGDPFAYQRAVSACGNVPSPWAAPV